MELDIRHFKLMVALAESGNMTKAAEELHLTQSALSHQLKDAEAKVGVPLFERKNKRLNLTPAGQELVQFSHEILGKIHDRVKLIREAGSLETRKIRIRAGCYTSFKWIPAILRDYSYKYPRVQLEVAGSLKAPISDIENNRADIAIVSDDHVKSKSLYVEPLFTDEMVLILSPQHHLAQKSFIKPKDLDGEDIVIYNVDDEDSTLISYIMKPAGAKPRRVTRMELTEGILELVKSGMGVGILADWAAAPHVSQGTLVMKSVYPKKIHRTWKAVARKKDSQEPHIKEFFSLLKSELKRGV